MKDYIKMTVLSFSDSKYELVSEEFSDRESASYFAECFSHNYNCKTQVAKSMNDGKFIVFARDVAVELVRGNLYGMMKTGEFANWKFEHR